MAFNDEIRFWIIFDTCTRPSYYQDVHNLLALPKGGTMRYEYRDQWLSSAAVKVASNPESAPSKILLVYAQWTKYQKGGGTPKPPPPSSEMLWVPTRIAEMQLIVQEGANFFFDFKVLDYPKVDEDTLLKILKPLIQAQEVPFHKWVCLSDDLQGLASLKRGKEDENWQSIVDRLGTPPMQFCGDSFWRLRGLFHGSTKELLIPTYRKQIRKVVSSYELFENESCVIEVISHNPPQSSQQERRLEVQFDKDGPFSVVGDTSLDLRQYTGHNVEIKVKRYEEMEERVGIIWLNSSPQRNQWPIGPKLSLRFTAKKKAWRALLSLFTLILGGVALAFAGTLLDKYPIWAVAIFLVGALLIVVKELLVTGKLPVKL